MPELASGLPQPGAPPPPDPYAINPLDGMAGNRSPLTAGFPSSPPPSGGSPDTIIPPGTNNPGNIKKLDGTFATFPSRQAGITAIGEWADRAQTMHGLTTLRQLIDDPRHGYAPSADPGNAGKNLPEAAARIMGVDPDHPINITDPAIKDKFVQAMLVQEGDGAHVQGHRWAEDDRAKYQAQHDDANRLLQFYMDEANKPDKDHDERMKLLHQAQEQSQIAVDAFNDIRKVPPVYKPLDPMQNFGSVATVLALLGGVFAKRPLTASLQAAGIAMQAQQSGNLDQFKIANEQWKTQSELGLTAVKITHDQIREILEDDRLAQSEKEARLHTLATGLQLANTERFRELEEARKYAEGLERLYQHGLDSQRRADDVHQRELDRQAGMPADRRLREDLITEWREANPGKEPSGADLAKIDKQAIAAKAEEKPPTLGQQHEDEKIAEVNSVLDRGDEVIAEIQGAMRVGFAGQVMRPAETLSNLLGVSDDTTRHRIESDIVQLRQLMTRLMNDRSIMTARDQDAAATIIRGLESGSTIANTQDSIQRAQDMLRQKYQSGLVRLNFMQPPQPKAAAQLPGDLPDPSGHPEGSTAKDKSGNPVAVIRNGQWSTP